MPSIMAISCSTPFSHTFSNYKISSNHTNRRGQILCSKSVFVVPSTRSRFSCSVSMADGQSNDHAKLNLAHLMDKAKKYYDELPAPIKSFPWDKVLDNFIQHIVNVTATVIKYLSVPMLAVSSFSEISYCAYQKLLLVVPFPLVLGFVVAGLLKKTASKSLPVIKDADVPWHLIAIAIFFTLLKLPGPYYPFWGRICIPHFANGGLLRVLWMIYLWYQRPETGVGARLQQTEESL